MSSLPGNYDQQENIPGIAFYFIHIQSFINDIGKNTVFGCFRRTPNDPKLKMFLFTSFL
jgi:hypothetical protein